MSETRATGTALVWSNDGTWTKIAEVLSITGPGLTNEPIDITHLGCTAREFIGGLPDYATIAFDLNFMPDETTHDAFVDAVRDGSTMSLGMRWSDFGVSSINILSINTTSNVINMAEAHSYITGQAVRLDVTGTVPTSTPQVVNGGAYFVRKIAADTLTLHRSSSTAIADENAINFSDAGSENALALGTTWTFNGLVSEVSPSVATGERLAATVTIKITGSVV